MTEVTWIVGVTEPPPEVYSQNLFSVTFDERGDAWFQIGKSALVVSKGELVTFSNDSWVFGNVRLEDIWQEN